MMSVRQRINARLGLIGHVASWGSGWGAAANLSIVRQEGYLARIATGGSTGRRPIDRTASSRKNRLSSANGSQSTSQGKRPSRR
jgi:hypothetical protein